MGLGLLHGSPKTHLSQDWYATGDRLAYWIEHEIPSFVGNVPAQYTEALLAAFQTHHVPDRIIREAFLKLEKKGTRFDRSVKGIGFRGGVAAPLPPTTSGKHATAPEQMREGIKGEHIDRYRFEEYERKYVLAIKTNDPAGAEAIIAAVLTLLWELARGYAKTKQAARNDKSVEWEEFNAAVNEALSRAKTLQTHIRYLSREELKSLRDAPTPTAVRNITSRIASRVTTRTIPPRRARK